MKFLLFLFLWCSLAAAGLVAAGPDPVYELRIYTTHPGKLPDLLTRFRDHTCAIFTRLGMVNVGYWTPVEQKDGDKLYYILQHPGRAEAAAAWKAFGSDPEWQSVRKASEANGPIVAHVDSIFLEPTDFSPTRPALARGAHVYELRTYTTNDGKLGELDDFFRDHLTKMLFPRHGIGQVLYTHPVEADQGAGKKFVYLIAHASLEAARKSWAEFYADPEWAVVRDSAQKNGKLLIPDGVKSVYLAPTDFSPLK